MTPEEMIRDKCWKAQRLGFEITPFRPGLQFEDGFYSPLDDVHPHCTTLEAVLLGEEDCCGSLVPDVAMILNVCEDWLRGFLAGQNVALAEKVACKSPV